MTLTEDLARMEMQAAMQCRCDTYENGDVSHCESHGESRSNVPALVEMVKALTEEIVAMNSNSHSWFTDKERQRRMEALWAEAQRKASAR